MILCQEFVYMLKPSHHLVLNSLRSKLMSLSASWAMAFLSSHFGCLSCLIWKVSFICCNTCAPAAAVNNEPGLWLSKIIFLANSLATDGAIVTVTDHIKYLSNVQLGLWMYCQLFGVQHWLCLLLCCSPYICSEIVSANCDILLVHRWWLRGQRSCRLWYAFYLKENLVGIRT